MPIRVKANLELDCGPATSWLCSLRMNFKKFPKSQVHHIKGNKVKTNKVKKGGIK